MNTRKYWVCIGELVVLILLMLNYFKFYTCYRGLGNLEEDFIYIYSDTALTQELVEEGQKHQIDCEIEVLKSGISAVIVRGMEALSYGEAESLFWGSDIKLDINLLQWFVFVVFVFFYGMVAFCVYLHMNRRNIGWGYFAMTFLGLLYIRRFVFIDMRTFPVWSLPAKWSDMEGWGELWESVWRQIVYVVQRKDCSFICRYYEGILKSMHHLFWGSMLVLFFVSIQREEFWDGKTSTF